jgi:hypothetical protein
MHFAQPMPGAADCANCGKEIGEGQPAVHTKPVLRPERRALGTRGLRQVIARFELEPMGINGALEANGRVYHFCTEPCRNMFAIDYPEINHLHAGKSDDWIPGTVCDECTVQLR